VVNKVEYRVDVVARTVFIRLWRLKAVVH